MSSERVRKLLAEATNLPTEERAELVKELARTLPTQEPPLDAEDLEAIEQSVRDQDAGIYLPTTAEVEADFKRRGLL